MADLKNVALWNEKKDDYERKQNGGMSKYDMEADEKSAKNADMLAKAETGRIKNAYDQQANSQTMNIAERKQKMAETEHSQTMEERMLAMLTDHEEKKAKLDSEDRNFEHSEFMDNVSNERELAKLEMQQEKNDTDAAAAKASANISTDSPAPTARKRTMAT